MLNRERTIRNSLYGSSRGCHLRVNLSIQFLQRLRAKVTRPAFNALLRLNAPHLKLLAVAKVSLRNFHRDRLATTIYTLQVIHSKGLRHSAFIILLLVCAASPTRRSLRAWSCRRGQRRSTRFREAGGA